MVSRQPLSLKVDTYLQNERNGLPDRSNFQTFVRSSITADSPCEVAMSILGIRILTGREIIHSFAMRQTAKEEGTQTVTGPRFFETEFQTPDDMKPPRSLNPVTHHRWSL